MFCQALCKLSELDSSEMSKEYKEPADSYVIGDVIRGKGSILHYALLMYTLKFVIKMQSSSLLDFLPHLGVIIDVNVEETRVLISLRRSRLPQAYKHLHLVILYINHKI